MVDPDPEQFAQPGVDLDHPNVARVYDYFLGGEANWAIDRQFAERVLTAFPLARPIARTNRVFLHRVVRYLVGQGVRQFIDVGSGVPTMGSTHAVADEISPGNTRVVYVDNEPVAVAHSQVLIEEDGDLDRHAVIQADLRDPDGLWAEVTATHKIDLSEPIGLLIIAVLHVQQLDKNGVDIGPRSVARYRELLPSGSYLVISHATSDGVPAEVAASLEETKKLYDAHSSPVVWRSHNQITQLFGDFRLIEPGITWIPSWHPELMSSDPSSATFEAPNESAVLAGVGRKE